MRYHDEGEPSPLPWIVDDEAVDETLRDVAISHEGGHESKADDGDVDTGADEESPR